LELFSGSVNMSISKRFIRAVDFAAHKHRNQRRKDSAQTPYINHPIRLAYILSHEAGIVQEDVLIAAVLHDTVEDTETSFEEIATEFGEEVAKIVSECTDDKSLMKAERKQKQIDTAHRKSREAKFVKLADKICNLTDILYSPPEGWSEERVAGYFTWAEKVVHGMRGTHEKLELMFDDLLEQQARKTLSNTG
jgi:GTP diphosphokinase / guanosine-3',5'-bis(diphosphate) 3'-diphosphatase